MVTFLNLVSYAATIWLLVSIVLGIYVGLKGLIPPLVRLGKGLSRRKIAIFAKGDNLIKLHNLLEGTKLFNKKNITDISSIDDFGRAEKSTLFLIVWNDWKGNIDEILHTKKGDTALVIYAPPQSITPSEFAKLDTHLNVMVSNFRGRLLNDIIVSLMTTGYQ